MASDSSIDPGADNHRQARPLEWMKAVRDHPERPSPEQCHVLKCLALRLDWATGAGFASNADLAADAEVSESTVKRATTWARSPERGLLSIERRGHRRGDGVPMANVWALRLPPGVSTAQGGALETVLEAVSAAQGGESLQLREANLYSSAEHPSTQTGSRPAYPRSRPKRLRLPGASDGIEGADQSLRSPGASAGSGVGDLPIDKTALTVTRAGESLDFSDEWPSDEPEEPGDAEPEPGWPYAADIIASPAEIDSSDEDER